MSCGLLRGPQLNRAAHSDFSGRPLSSISRWPVSKINEKSLEGSSLSAAIAALIEADVGCVDVTPVVGEAAAGGRGGPKFAARPGLPPRRPPDKLSQPSTLSLKKSVRMIRFDVRPPCECPTSQNALMFSLPSWSITEVAMFCRYVSSSADQTRVGEFGVAMTRRYLSLKSMIGK